MTIKKNAKGFLPGRVKAPEDKLIAGRPLKPCPPDALEVITAACAGGATKTGVAMALGCSVLVLERWLSEQPELKDALIQGREKERQTLHDVLTNAAKGGNIVSAIFLLKARHGYVEGQQENQANRVSVTFNIPGATPLDKFNNSMVIDNDTGH